jgi:hypothetical protein
MKVKIDWVSIGALCVGMAIGSASACGDKPSKVAPATVSDADVERLIEQVQSNQLNQTTLLMEIKQEVESQKLKPLLPEVRS